MLEKANFELPEARGGDPTNMCVQVSGNTLDCNQRRLGSVTCVVIGVCMSRLSRLWFEKGGAKSITSVSS